MCVCVCACVCERQADLKDSFPADPNEKNN